MLKGLRAAETAMNIQLTRTNVLANNLANADTAGFKQVLTQVTETAAAAATGESVGVRTVDGRSLELTAPLDTTQGTLRETGRTLDVALMGDGYFKVARDGQTYYTRNGSFSLDAERRLVTADGSQVQGEGGPITLPEGEIVVRPDGAILVDGVELDRLSVSGFEAPENLLPMGDSAFKASESMAAKAVDSDEVRIAQGMLEDSNADPIDTMIAMIAAQRAFELEAKILQSSDNTLDKAVNELSRKA